MKQLFREIVFITLCLGVAFIAVQIIDDMVRMSAESARERRQRREARRDHPSNSGPRYE